MEQLYNKTGRMVSNTNSRRKTVKKKRRKNSEKKIRDRKEHRRSAKTAVVDSSVIISGIQYGGEESRKVINSSRKRGQLIYIPQVHKEVTAGRPGQKKVRHRLKTFTMSMKKKMADVVSPTKEEVRHLPVGGKDKIVYREAEEAGAKHIISIDRGFIESTGKMKIKAIMPSEYIKRKRRDKYRGRK